MFTFYTTFLSKSDFSFALFLVTFEHLEIQQSNIPLKKALKCGIIAVGAQGCSCMSTFCHAPRKIALLLHKMAIVCNQTSMAVAFKPKSMTLLQICTIREFIEILWNFMRPVFSWYHKNLIKNAYDFLEIFMEFRRNIPWNFIDISDGNL